MSITSGATSTLAIAITNTGSSAVTGVSLSDPLPTSPGAMTVASPPAASASAGCLSPFTPAAGATVISYSGGVAANSTCTLQVNVTAAAGGTYSNTTGPLLVNSVDSGVSASANLTVAAASSGSGICGLTLARWTFSPGTATATTYAADIHAADVTTYTASFSPSASQAVDTSLGNTLSGGSGAASWSAYGWGKTTLDTAVYYQFAVDTHSYTNVQLRFAAYRKSPGPNNLWVYSYNAGGTAPGSVVGTYSNHLANATTWYAVPAAGTIDFSSLASTSGVTNFLILASGANNASSGSDLQIDDVAITGCGTAQKPTLAKTFTPATIAAGSTSTLTFTLTNPNSVPLTAAAFSDSLPSGMRVAASPAASSTCAGVTFNPAAGATSFTLSGASLPASGSCTAQVDVTVTNAGTYLNNSGFLSSAESGTNSGAGGSASATLTALAPPQISKVFGPNPVKAGSPSTLTFTITNPNPGTGLTGVAFTDDLPLNLGIASPPAAAQCGGTLSTALVVDHYRITLVGGVSPRAGPAR